MCAQGNPAASLAPVLRALLGKRLPLFTLNYDLLQEEAINRCPLDYEDLVKFSAASMAEPGTEQAANPSYSMVHAIDAAFTSTEDGMWAQAAIQRYVFHLHGIFYQDRSPVILHPDEYAASAFRNKLVPFLEALVDNDRCLVRFLKIETSDCTIESVPWYICSRI